MKARNEGDPAELRRIFNLDIDRGVLTWKVVSKFHPQRLGTDVGSVRPDGYVSTKINGREVLMHRLIWAFVHGEWPKAEIDHVDLDKANNRPNNLREATRSQNCLNKRVNRRSSIGIKGVTFDKEQKRYRAQIGIERERICLGRYDTAEEAGRAYEAASVRLAGEYSRTA